MKRNSLRITILSAAIACAFAAPAFGANNNANGPGDDTIGGTTSTSTATGGNSTSTATGGNVVGSGNSNANGGDSRSYSTVGDLTNRQSQYQSAKSEGSESSSGGNSLTVNQNDVRQKLQAPGLMVGNASPSHPCALTGGFALSVPGGAGQIAGSKTAEGCERREWYRLLVDVDAATAWHVACADPLLKDAPRCKAAQPAAASAPAAAATTVPTRTAMVGGRQ